MKARKGCLWGAGIFVLALGLIVCAAGGLWGWRSGFLGVEQPTVRVFQPQPNATLNLRTPVAVQAAAESQNRPIAWLRFYVDNLLSGEQTGAGKQIIGTWNWVPTTGGMHTLAFVASTTGGKQAMVTVPVVVLAAVDRDGDGLPDEQDDCADQPGPEAGRGCPLADDADGDGIRDAEDACPQEAGEADQRGCSMANRPDQDRDGTPDWEDRCPSQSGLPQWNGCPQDALLTDSDADGLIDAVDWCPDQPGPAENGGCPARGAGDQDGDGVVDGQDMCPEQPGASRGGCPLAGDRDQDGIPDEADSCPDNPNPNFECMDVQFIDSDGDGTPDFMDDCPDQPGVLEQRGCPAPNDQDGDGVSDETDNCDSRPGPASNNGCPTEINYPRIGGGMPNILCLINPDACTYSDIDCNANPEACGLSEGCFNDSDCDGVINNIDICPNQFGMFFVVEGVQGCPPDNNNDGIPDPDQDGDGVVDHQDACPQMRGMFSNGGCPRQEVDLTLFLLAIWSPQRYANFYCYFQLQEGDWGRIPPEGSLTQSGQVFDVNQGVSLHLTGNDLLRYRIFCEGQPSPFEPVQVVGNIARAHGPEFWNSQILDAYADNGQLLVEYRICEGSCR